MSNCESVIRYMHHGALVYVKEESLGKHQNNCLCYCKCKHFKPENREENCPRANELYAYDVKWGMTTPVWECPAYEKKE